MQTQNMAPVQRMITRYEAETSLIFKPSKKFYSDTGINRVRFAQLANGEKQPLFTEVEKLVKFFSRFFPTSINDFTQ